jgi:hypothetical protein
LLPAAAGAVEAHVESEECVVLLPMKRASGMVVSSCSNIEGEFTRGYSRKCLFDACEDKAYEFLDILLGRHVPPLGCDSVYLFLLLVHRGQIFLL